MGEKVMLRVHELVYCSFFKTRIPDAVVERLMKEGEEIHRMIQRDYLEKCGHDCEAEREFKLDLGAIELVGHVDIVDYRGPWVIEIKPFRRVGSRGYYRHLYQLSLYTAAMRRLEGIDFKPLLLYYRRYGEHIYVHKVQPFVICINVLNEVRRWAHVLAEARKRDLPVCIRGPWCKDCVLNNVVRPDAVEIRWGGGGNLCNFEVRVPEGLAHGDA